MLLLSGCMLLFGSLVASIAIFAVALLVTVQGTQLGLVRLTFAEPTRNSPPPTSTSTPVATPHSAVALATATPAPTVKMGAETLSVDQVLFAEDFYTNTKKWKVEETPARRLYLEDGEYHVEVTEPYSTADSLITMSRFPISSDFVLVVDARTVQGSSQSQYGLMFGDGLRGHYYELVIGENGYYTIRYWGVDERGRTAWITLVRWQETMLVRPQGQWNSLGVIRRGPTLTFYLNGKKLSNLEDSPHTPLGAAGVYVGTEKEPASVAFDNLTLAVLP